MEDSKKKKKESRFDTQRETTSPSLVQKVDYHIASMMAQHTWSMLSSTVPGSEYCRFLSAGKPAAICRCCENIETMQVKRWNSNGVPKHRDFFQKERKSSHWQALRHWLLQYSRNWHCHYYVAMMHSKLSSFSSPTTTEALSSSQHLMPEARSHYSMRIAEEHD